MPRRRWLPYITAIVLAIAVCKADAQPIGDDPRSNASANQTQTKPQTDQTPIILDAIERGINRITGALEALKPEPKSATEEYRADRDLNAQEEMAYWAKLMFWSAVASVILTAFGVVLLARTLVYTKRAAKFAGEAVTETKKATKAANETVEAARESAIIATRQARYMEETSERPLRAYITVEAGGVLIWEPGYRAHGRVYARNVGQTPAYNITVAAKLHVSKSLPTVDVTGNAIVILTGDMHIAPGRHQLVAVEDDIDDFDIEAVLEDQKWIMLFGYVKYRDAFKQDRETRFCHLYRGKDRLGKDYVRYHHIGNSAT